MSEISADTKRAGQLLLEGLRQFNQAAVLFGTLIEPAFQQSVENIIDEYVQNWGMDGELNWDKDIHWFASKDWMLNDERTAQFKDYMSYAGEEDYWLAVVTGTGTRDVEWGYRFSPVRSAFGGTQSFNRWIKNQNGGPVASIVALKIRHEGKGDFFLPLKFDAKLLASCWSEYGEFREEHELFDPVRKMMDTIKQALPHFNLLLKKAEAELSHVRPAD